MILRLPAYAKVNLSLEILRRRSDGFHAIVSVTQLITLADRLEVEPADTLSIMMRPPVVDRGENLVTKAAHALADATGRAATGAVRIEKRIPLAAGLGGGSSNAAATLRLLDRLWGTALSPEKLTAIGAGLGSDVPLFFGGGLNLIRGRGEIVEPLRPTSPFGLLLIYPGGAPADKTRRLYGALTSADYGDGAATNDLRHWLSQGRPIGEAPLVNGFDGAANRVYPGFADLRAELVGRLGRTVHVSGAGPTLFALYGDIGEARSAEATIADLGHTTYVARSIAHRPPIRTMYTS